MSSRRSDRLACKTTRSTLLHLAPLLSVVSVNYCNIDMNGCSLSECDIGIRGASVGSGHVYAVLPIMPKTKSVTSNLTVPIDQSRIPPCVISSSS